MAIADTENFNFDTDNTSQNSLKFTADGQDIELPDASFVRDSDMTRDGMDLVLEGPDGTVVIEGYFAAEPQPNLTTPEGQTLTPDLVNSFAKNTMEFADAGSMTDESPVGSVQEVSGEATVTRMDGTTETISIGTPIFQGDIVETNGEGAVNIVFIDETSFAVSEDARLAIDEYVFDPATQSGSQNFSVLKGVFVFTSGMIGRDDPDDVEIDTPMGSIGIRGTIIAGNADTGEITVIEGAIVLQDFQGHEMTLAMQFETARFGGEDSIENIGELDASEVAARYESISDVAPDLFSSIQDAAQENGDDAPGSDDDGADAGDGSNPIQTATGNGGLPGNDGNTQNNADGSGNNSAAAGSGDDGHSGDDGSGGGNDYTYEPPPPPDGGGEPPQETDPDFIDVTPEGVFLTGTDLTWSHNFTWDFVPGGPGSENQIVEFNLGIETSTMLDDLQTAGVIDSWNFDNASGNAELTIDFAGDFTGPFNGSIAVPGGILDTLNLEINVYATDVEGDTGSHIFTLAAADINNDYATGTMTAGQSNGVYTSSVNTLNMSNTDNVTVFMNHDDSNVNLLGGSQGNFVVLGNGAIQNVYVDSTSTNNKIFGGDGSDKFTLDTTSVEAIGGNGSDSFTLSGSAISEFSASDESLSLDGGANASRADAFARHLRGGGPFDSTLDDLDILQINDTLDFSYVDHGDIRNIDVLDIKNAATGQTITLNAEDVLHMSDPQNTLVINMDSSAGDIVNLSGFTLEFDNVSYDYDGGGADNYDVYTNGDGVTLFILDDSGVAGGTAGVNLV